MSTNPTSQCRGFIRSHLVRYALLLAGGLIAAATPAFAQSFNNLCIKEQIGGNPPCTANDVRVGSMQLIAGPSSCDPTNPTPFAVTIEATIESGPDRYDIGLWLNTEGGSALSDPSGANCYRNYLHPVGSFTACQQQGGPTGLVTRTTAATCTPRIRTLAGTR